MKCTKLFALTLVFVFCNAFSLVKAQSTQATTQKVETETRPGGNTLARQFQQMRDKSTTYQGYKVINQNTLGTFWKNVQDSIRSVSKELVIARNKIDSQEAEFQKRTADQTAEVKRIQQELQEQKKIVERNTYESARISLLGIPVLKENYLTITWGIIAALMLAVAVAVLKYMSSNKITVRTQNEYEAVKQELNGYKQRLRERETVLARELQTERNKVEELSQRIASLK
jgi:hypothetical protein